jgi:hypothetical protein
VHARCGRSERKRPGFPVDSARGRPGEGRQSFGSVIRRCLISSGAGLPGAGPVVGPSVGTLPGERKGDISIVFGTSCMPDVGVVAVRMRPS